MLSKVNKIEENITKRNEDKNEKKTRGNNSNKKKIGMEFYIILLLFISIVEISTKSTQVIAKVGAKPHFVYIVQLLFAFFSPPPRNLIYSCFTFVYPHAYTVSIYLHYPCFSLHMLLF